MSYKHSAAVASPIDEVFAWHARPGAIVRLVPPWQPLEVIQEASSLADGTAILGLPGGLRWVAVHDPASFEPGRRFVDVLRTPVLSQLLGWTHEHLFEAADESTTKVTDSVRTTVPGKLLEQTFAYRARQLRDDLRAHACMGPAAGPLSVAVTGSTGLIGTALCAFLSTGGHRVIRLVRSGPTGSDRRLWNPDQPDPSILDGVDAVVHLAGSPVAGRFSQRHKDAVRNSRVGPTRALARLVGERTFVVASAVGWYGPDRGDEELAEGSSRGSGFLADVVAEWEAAADAARESGARVVHLRTGIVLSPRGGILKVLRPLFELGLGGRLGSGRQWVSWIGIDDMVDAYLRCLVDPALEGAVNAAAPNPVTNAQLAATLARVLRRPALAPVPALGPKLLLGPEAAREFVLAGQRVVPGKLIAAGHQFRHPDLESALRHLFGKVRQVA